MSLWTSLELITIIYSSGLKILSKFMKLYNKDFPIGYFTADFLQQIVFWHKSQKLNFARTLGYSLSLPSIAQIFSILSSFLRF